MAARLQRRDAEILKHELNCNMVRCSHYPQSPHFLDACDELGLMVWEEPPGWQYVGGRRLAGAGRATTWPDMVVRDRSRPSVIVWATRLNETADHPGLYARTRRRRRASWTASRQTSRSDGVRHSAAGWDEDVFGYDDYHCRRGSAGCEPPLPGVPYLVSEAVGALTGRRRTAGPTPGRCWPPRRCCTPRCTTSPGPTRGTPGCSAGPASTTRRSTAATGSGETLKTPGVLDTFRVPKPGAAFYRSQVDPRVRPGDPAGLLLGLRPGSPPARPRARTR